MVGSLDNTDKRDANSQLIESNDAPAKELLNDAIDPAIQLNISTTELGSHDTVSKIHLKQQNGVLGPLSDISGQCLNTRALSIDQNQFIERGEEINSTFAGVLGLASNEFIDVDTRDILNICLHDANVDALKSKLNSDETPKIQVLAETNCANSMEKSDEKEPFNEFNLDRIDFTDNIETLAPNAALQSVKERLVIESTDMQAIQTEFAEQTDGKSQSSSQLSSTITFYCESLDNLKDVDSASDVDIEEI